MPYIMGHLVENNGTLRPKALVSFTQTNDLKTSFSLEGGTVSHLNMFFSKRKKKKASQPNTSSLNFQYNVPKHIRNIYHVLVLLQC